MSQTEYTKATATPLKLEAEILATECVPAAGLSTYSDGAGGAVVIHTEALDEQVVQELEQAVEVHVAETGELVNYLEFRGAESGSRPAIQACGTDANIDVQILGKGTGYLVTENAWLITPTIERPQIEAIYYSGPMFLFPSGDVDDGFMFSTTGGVPTFTSFETPTDLAIVAYDISTSKFQTNDLHMNNPAGTFEYQITPSAILADRVATLPVLTGDDTFVFEAHGQTLTNKTLTSPVLTTPQINNLAATFQYIITPTAIGADRIATLPLLTGDDEFVFKDHAQTLTNKTLTTPTINDPVVTIYDDDNLNFGTDSDAQIAWETTGNDCLQIGVTCGAATGSGYVVLCEKADLGDADRSPLATSTDPVLRIYSADATNATDYIQFRHDQTNPRIEWGLPAENLIFACTTATATAVEFANMSTLVWNENTNAYLYLNTHHATVSYGADVLFVRSKGTHTSPTTVAADDKVAGMRFQAYSNAYYERANITCEIDGAVSTTTVPMRIVFNTGTTSATESFRIKSDRNVLFATSNQLQFRDTTAYINSSGVGVLVFTATTLTFTAGASFAFTGVGHTLIEGGHNLLGFFGAVPAAQSAAYTITNRSADRTLNCDSTSDAELADVLGTVIYDLQQLGLLGSPPA